LEFSASVGFIHKALEDVADASGMPVPVCHTTQQHIQETCNHSVQIAFGTLINKLYFGNTKQNNLLFYLYRSFALSIDFMV
jgi:hypothetical protein